MQGCAFFFLLLTEGQGAPAGSGCALGNVRGCALLRIKNLFFVWNVPFNYIKISCLPIAHPLFLYFYC